jgi:GNAT superfamily N-acetyltransferase
MQTTKETMQFSLLNEIDEISEFDSGEEELNAFLKNLALLYQRRHFGITVLCTLSKKAKTEIIGYYTLCPASIQREILPEKFLTGPKPNPIPAYRLCRLAIDKRYQGKGYGKFLFVHALKKCLDQAKKIGGHAVIIDAKDEKAKQFYEHFGFIGLPNNPLVLLQSMKYIEKHF